MSDDFKEIAYKAAGLIQARRLEHGYEHGYAESVIFNAIKEAGPAVMRINIRLHERIKETEARCGKAMKVQRDKIDELTQKGQELCNQNGGLLIENHDLKREVEEVRNALLDNI